MHVVYPAGHSTVSEQEYPLLVRLFATHLLAHADQYDAALAADGARSTVPGCAGRVIALLKMWGGPA